MKKLVLSIFLILICYLGFSQYPLQQNLGSASTLVQVPANGGLRAGLITISFVDTVAANLTNIKYYDGAIIKTTDPIIALWYRHLATTQWIQILPSGGSGGQRSWLIDGNSGIFTSPVSPQRIGLQTAQGLIFITNNTDRLQLDSSGIKAETGTTIGLGYDPSDDNKLTAFSGGSSGWALTGNGGTTAGTNFVGTTDDVDLVFKRNSVESGRFGSSGNLTLGLTGTTSGGLGLSGSTSGLISILPQAAAGTYNFNLPTTAGTSGYLLTSAGGGGSPMTWTDPASLTISLTAIGSTPNANGATISGSDLNLEPASASFGGVVTTGTQTFAGVKTFNSNIGIAGNAGASGDNQLIFGGNSTTFRRIYGVNSNAGNGAGVGMVLQNDIGNTFQLSFNSLLNLYEPDGAYIRTNGTGGYRFSHDGAGSKVRWSTSNATGIESGAYLGWDADEFYHIAIPQAASTSGKTVLLYDTASGGYFSQISLDSIGGSGGSGANTALSNLASVAINTSLLPGVSDNIDLGSTTFQWRDLYLGEGQKIDWDNGDVTMTQSGNNLTVAGGAFIVTNAEQTPASFTSTFAGNMQVNWNSSTGNNVNFVFQDAGTARWYIGNNSATGSDRLHILNASAAEAVTVLQGLQVGINQTAPTARLHIGAGATTANYAPLKFTSGSLNTTAEVGAVEFLTDKWYGTITTGAARKEFVMTDNSIGGNLLFTDNTYDIGASGATRPRTGYFGTSLFSPLIVGGTGTTDDLTFKTTTGVGASGADMHFQVGNNGATEAMTILNDGKVGITNTAPATALHTVGTVRIGSTATQAMDLRTEYISGSNNFPFGYINVGASGTAPSSSLFQIAPAYTSAPSVMNFFVSNNGGAYTTGYRFQVIVPTAASGNPVTLSTAYSSGGTIWEDIAIGGHGTEATANLYVESNGNVGVGVNNTTPTSILHTNGSFATAYASTATSTTLSIAHQVMAVTATGQTITLPAAAGITGRIYTVKLTAAGTCTVDGNASETIDGATTYSLSAQYKYVTIQSDGTNWNIIANN